MTAEELFTAALAKVESASIRAWAQTDHNRPIFVKIAQAVIDDPKHDAAGNVDRMVIVIVGNAIGLF